MLRYLFLKPDVTTSGGIETTIFFMDIRRGAEKIPVLRLN